ncbi:MAG: Stp1/IreP family PP2C-type Ser/Thr phosphatase [Nitriliruptor sp.]|nr:MAG: Stp1/IreP family PP2C-type Ser/Thr phosphatase [Nitriliruptor sp.]
MRRFIAAGTSDVGRVREGNEDAYLVADSVVAVADGMGGHLAGEVASSTALEPLRELDGRIFPDAGEALAALRDAVVAANETVVQMAADEPSYRGMGTTLTAALLEGRRLHVAHVGDSRAYLFRDGTFSQLTDDHTFVQHLIDEGQITREEAAKHPQRSMITRAIGVSEEIDVDAMTLELQPDDVVLLCSDGLTGPVSDQAIAEVLGSDDDLDTSLDRLIEMANEAGGPDNITAVILRFEDSDAEATQGPRPVAIQTRDDRGGDDWANRLGSFGSIGSGGGSFISQQSSDRDDPARFGGLVLRSLAIVVGIALLAGGLYGGGRFLLAQSYFISLEEEQVVIFQGIDADLGPLSLSWVSERSELMIDDVAPYYRPTLEEGFPAADINDARRLVRGIPLREDQGEDAEDAADELDTDDGATPDEDATGDGTP